MAFFVDLSFFQIDRIGIEVSARVLPVFVEEQIVKVVGQVVMMGDVALRLADGIVLLEATKYAAHIADEGVKGMVLDMFNVLRRQIDKIVQRAALDRQRTLHIGFADR